MEECDAVMVKVSELKDNEMIDNLRVVKELDMKNCERQNDIKRWKKSYSEKKNVIGRRIKRWTRCVKWGIMKLIMICEESGTFKDQGKWEKERN